MKRLILTEAPGKDGFVTIAGGDYRHLARSRRIKPGDGVEAETPGGRTLHLEVRAVDRSAVYAQAVCLADEFSGGVLAALPELPPLYLLQAMPKPPKLDLIARQAAELGAAALIPFYADRSPPGRLRGERLRAIIRQAREQSGSPVETRLEEPLSFDGLFERWRALKEGAARPAAIFLHEVPLSRTSLHRALAFRPGILAAAIGPEGGLSAREAARFTEAGFTPIIAGRAILRVETAALYALATVKQTLLERESWTVLNE